MCDEEEARLTGAHGSTHGEYGMLARVLARENQETKPPPAGWHGSSMAVAYKGEPGNQTRAGTAAWRVGPTPSHGMAWW